MWCTVYAGTDRIMWCTVYAGTDCHSVPLHKLYTSIHINSNLTKLKKLFTFIHSSIHHVLYSLCWYWSPFSTNINCTPAYKHRFNKIEKAIYIIHSSIHPVVYSLCWYWSPFSTNINCTPAYKHRFNKIEKAIYIYSIGKG
jgi:hypothetical protein